MGGDPVNYLDVTGSEEKFYGSTACMMMGGCSMEAPSEEEASAMLIELEVYSLFCGGGGLTQGAKHLFKHSLGFLKGLRKVDPNKMSHIFGQAKHNLDGLVKAFGSSEKAFRALEKATQAAVKNQGIKGVFETTVKVGGESVTVRGNVVDGVVKIGTAFK